MTSGSGAVTSALILLVAFVIGCTPGSSVAPTRTAPGATPTGRSTAMDFQLTSSAFSDGGEIPARHTCDGDDISLPVGWSGTPPETAELALVMD
ncbi:MAG: hypothetical protein M3253_01145, partial [Chloroflexota bacterium]|nr:hypothetical protein [Chloroflexota bacterium]